MESEKLIIIATLLKNTYQTVTVTPNSPGAVYLITPSHGRQLADQGRQARDSYQQRLVIRLLIGCP